MNRRRTDGSTRAASRPCRPSVRQTPVNRREANQALPGWDYADAFETSWSGHALYEAEEVARSFLGPSRSARRVLAARDAVVRPLGLKDAHQGNALLFPVLSQTPEQVVCGLDDRHLDFRVIISVLPGAVRCTTVVRRHGVVGATYLAIVGPFHRGMVPRLVRRGLAMMADADGPTP